MGQSLAVMNTKGGVGKSTVVMALAETLSVHHGKTVLVIDSDSQTSMSCMLMDIARWEQIERRQRTIVDYLVNQILGPADQDWRDYIASGVSDVEEARSIYLMPSHMELALFEREVSTQKQEVKLRAVIRKLLQDARAMFDIVIVDCPPGLSLLTECWLRECNYLIPPTKPDYLGVRGFSILKRFLEQYSDQGFAELLGVLINLKDDRAAIEDEWHKRLAADPTNRCFASFIPRRAYVQRAASFEAQKRTYIAKYPGDAGQCMRSLAAEVLERIAGNAPVAAKDTIVAPGGTAAAATQATAAYAPTGMPGTNLQVPDVLAPAAAFLADQAAARAPLPRPAPLRPATPEFAPSSAISAAPAAETPQAAEKNDDDEVVLSLLLPTEPSAGFLAGAAAQDGELSTRTAQSTSAATVPPEAAELPAFRAPVWGGKPALAQTMRVPRVYAPGEATPAPGDDSMSGASAPAAGDSSSKS